MAAADPGSPRPTELLHIDWTRCDGRGLCTELVPELLGRDEWGYPLAATLDGRGVDGRSVDGRGVDGRGVARDRSNVAVPPALLDAARDAVALCPRQALRLRIPD